MMINEDTFIYFHKFQFFVSIQLKHIWASLIAKMNQKAIKRTKNGFSFVLIDSFNIDKVGKPQHS